MRRGSLDRDIEDLDRRIDALEREIEEAARQNRAAETARQRVIVAREARDIFARILELRTEHPAALGRRR